MRFRTSAWIVLFAYISTIAKSALDTKYERLFQMVSMLLLVRVVISNMVQQLPIKISSEYFPQTDIILKSSILVGSIHINPMTTGQKQQVPQ
jgi:hypothetical protein